MRALEAREPQRALLSQERMWATLPSKFKTPCKRLNNYLKRSLQVKVPQSCCRKTKILLVRERAPGIQCSKDGPGRLPAQHALPSLGIPTPMFTKGFRIFAITFGSITPLLSVRRSFLGTFSVRRVSSPCLWSFLLLLIINIPNHISK